MQEKPVNINILGKKDLLKIMRRIDKAFKCFAGKLRCQIVEEHCPYDMDASLENMDINTYHFSNEAQAENTEPGCSGITCEECWEKEIK